MTDPGIAARVLFRPPSTFPSTPRATGRRSGCNSRTHLKLVRVPGPSPVRNHTIRLNLLSTRDLSQNAVTFVTGWRLEIFSSLALFSPQDPFFFSSALETARIWRCQAAHMRPSRVVTGIGPSAHGVYAPQQSGCSCLSLINSMDRPRIFKLLLRITLIAVGFFAKLLVTLPFSKFSFSVLVKL